jgi:hypothetical protein
MSTLELALLQKPVILCNNIHLSQKTFTIISKKKQYYNFINQQINKKTNKLSNSQLVDAKKYCYLFYKVFPFKFPYDISSPYFNYYIFSYKNFNTYLVNLTAYGKTIHFLEGNSKTKYTFKNIIKNFMKNSKVINIFYLLSKEVQFIINYFFIRLIFANQNFLRKKIYFLNRIFKLVN